MLDAFAYPVSALMNLWHDLLSLVVPSDSGVAWVGSILFLVVTVRSVLLPMTWSQLRTSRRLIELRPRLAALKTQHGTNRIAYAETARRLQREEGVGAAGFLPLLVQLPVFLGLYHLLAGFTGADAVGGNGVFGPDDVHAFAHATVAGVPLAAAVRSSAAVLDHLQAGLGVTDVLVVALPLLLLAALATWINTFTSTRRQPPVAGDDPVAATLGSVTRAMVWFAPVSVLAGGLLFPVPLALILYWAVNGTWTTAQTVIMNRLLDRRLQVTT